MHSRDMAFFLSYNLSWASQLDVLAGSEKDFVAECRARKRKCFEAAVQNLSTLPPLSAAFFQEVATPDLCSRVRAKLPNLKGSFRGCVWHPDQNVAVHLLTVWDEDAIGDVIAWHSVFNLRPESDARPCTLVLVRRSRDGRQTLLVNAHFPWFETDRELRGIERAISQHLPVRIKIHAVVFGGDTNDARTLITKQRPLRVGRYELSHGMSKASLRRHLRTCCWHEKGHEWGLHQDTGDYVLSDRRVASLRVPASYDGDEALHSDHKPVLAKIHL